MTAQELQIIRSVLVANKVIDASASDGDVATAHAMTLQSPSATQYKAQLEAQGVAVGPNWLTVVGVVGGLVAIYFIWQHYQKPELVDAREYPEPYENRHRIRSMGKALGAFKFGSAGRSSCAGPRLSGSRKFGGASSKYEFEPEIRLEGYRRRKARRSAR